MSKYLTLVQIKITEIIETIKLRPTVRLKFSTPIKYQEISKAAAIIAILCKR